MQGVIKENNKLKHFGFITTENGQEVFFHFEAFDDPACLLSKEDDVVEFVLVEGARGYQAAHIKPVK